MDYWTGLLDSPSTWNYPPSHWPEYLNLLCACAVAFRAHVVILQQQRGCSRWTTTTAGVQDLNYNNVAVLCEQRQPQAFRTQDPRSGHGWD